MFVMFYAAYKLPFRPGKTNTYPYKLDSFFYYLYFRIFVVLRILNIW
jgi:hypothetical protein